MPSKKRKKGWGNDLIPPLSDRADCMWCMTFLYYHKHFTFICSFAPIWLLNCRLHIVQSNIVSTINIIDIYVTLFSSFHKLFSVLKLTEIVILWVYYTIPFGFSLFFDTFWASLFIFLLKYFVWLRITYEG